MNQPLAYIHPEAKIADNVVIEPFATIHKDVVIDKGSWIGSNVIIMEGSRIGKNCKVFPGSVISGIPQDLKYSGERTTTEIGDNTVIREFVTISRGTTDKHRTFIGKNCLIMAYVHIAHDCEIGDNVILVNSVQVAGHVKVDDYAIIGGATAVHQFVKIGPHVMVAGGSLVRKDVPPYVTAAGNPLVMPASIPLDSEDAVLPTKRSMRYRRFIAGFTFRAKIIQRRLILFNWKCPVRKKRMKSSTL